MVSKGSARAIEDGRDVDTTTDQLVDEGTVMRSTRRGPAAVTHLAVERSN